MASDIPTAGTEYILRISEAPASFFRKGRTYCVSNLKDKVSKYKVQFYLVLFL
jgi:hypothetical protein